MARTAVTRQGVEKPVVAAFGGPPTGYIEEGGAGREEGVNLLDPVLYVPVRPVHEVPVTASVAVVEKAAVVVHDCTDDVEAWAAETSGV